jgi:hypothetical protein
MKQSRQNPENQSVVQTRGSNISYRYVTGTGNTGTLTVLPQLVFICGAETDLFFSVF